MKDNRQIVVVGDIHGCLEEFEDLLNKINYNPNTIRLILAGDIMDRGPYPVETLRKVMSMGIESILGNHEDWHIRWRKHSLKERETGKKNPMPPKGQKRTSENEALTSQEIEWLSNLPLKIELAPNWWLIHGGCESRFSFKDQEKNQLLRCRYLNDDGHAVPLDKNKQPPAGSKYWTSLWNGPESFVYGHCVHSLEEIRVDSCSNGAKCIGIDTGCVFGGRLTALLFPQLEVVQVQAKKVYKALTPEE